MKQRRKGITLIELLVSIGIMLMLSVILHSVFTIALRGWRKADNMLQVTTIARVVLERMTREISSAMIKPGSDSYYCVGFDKSSPSGWRTNSIADEFYFIAPLKTGNPEGSDICEVGYWLDGQGTSQSSDDILRRLYVTNSKGTVSFDFKFETGRSDEFSLNITNLEFTFFDSGDNAYTTWDSSSSGSGVPPAKIKILITVAVGKGTEETNPDFITKDFSTVVSLPR